MLVVGAGNSGAEIAIEAARGHQVWMSGRDTGQVPFRISSLIGRTILVRVVLRGLFHHVLTVDTPMGRKVRPKVLSKGGPLIRTRSRDLAAAGVERDSTRVGVKDGRPVLEDGRALDPRNVVWCTGFHPGFSWIDLPVFDADGRPKQERGMALDQPGLYFVGLHFLYAFSSTMIHGVGRDADRVASTIEGRVRATEPAGARAVPARCPFNNRGARPRPDGPRKTAAAPLLTFNRSDFRVHLTVNRRVRGSVQTKRSGVERLTVNCVDL